MSRIAIVYWSGIGNTETMAGNVAEGVRSVGAEAEVIPAADFSAARMEDFDAVAFGCPAMGAEKLEDGEFLPMFESCEAGISGKKIALFGSYGWGDGEWMRSWEQRCKNDGAVLACDSVICNEARMTTLWPPAKPSAQRLCRKFFGKGGNIDVGSIGCVMAAGAFVLSK